MENIVQEKAYAKLNISLDVSKPREDGYHDMRMVMQAISLSDDVEIELCEGETLRAESNVSYIPGDERNLAVKAAKLYLMEAGLEGKQGALIRIRKRIPVGAGMAGGSSDAAAVLRALNSALHALPAKKLFHVAAKIGSDVAFCLTGGTALAEGRGEVLTRLPDLPNCCFVICKPEFSISTPELFRALDQIRLRAHPDTAGICEGLKNGDLKQICRRMYNVFEDVPDRRMNVAKEIRGRLINAGAEGAIMTGTGSAVFGIFENEETANEICSELKTNYSFACTAHPIGVQQPLPD